MVFISLIIVCFYFYFYLKKKEEIEIIKEFELNAIRRELWNQKSLKK